MSSSACFQPSTPTSHRNASSSYYSHFPLNSSPLASSPMSHKSSPASAAQARRRDQHKQVASPPSAIRSRPFQSRSLPSSSRPSIPASDTGGADAPRKAVLRDRFKARCIERAQKDRARKISGRRGLSNDASSDGADADMDVGEEEEGEFLNDELFSRIMQSVNTKQKHQYKLSYQQDVGSSFDPELDDIAEWENELKDPQSLSTEPEDLDEEELAAYVEEYQVLQDLQGLPMDDFYSLSDLEDIPEEEPFDWKGKGRAPAASQDMDTD